MHSFGDFFIPWQLVPRKSQVFDQVGALGIVLTPYCTDRENDNLCRRVTGRISHTEATVGFKPSPGPAFCVQFPYSLLMLPT